MGKNQFEHRIAFGVWINDIRSEPIIDSWPSVIIDERTMKDYTDLILLLVQNRYTALDIFGLLTNHDWPMDIVSVINSDRKKLVNEMIDIAHQHNIQIIYGLGVYSWGFDQIIRNDPEVRGTNPSAMCGSKPKSKEWQEKTIDFVSDNFDIDGFHLEVADQGRCKCAQCINQGNVQYFSRLNKQTAQYILSKWSDKLLLVNTSGYLPWGDFIKKDEYHHVYDLGESIDVLIDGGNHGLFIREEDRADFISGFPCSYGTSGGFWVYPPQRWDRVRWFIPYLKRSSDHLKELYRDGGRACELYMGPVINPGVEMNIVCNGLRLSDVERKSDDILMEAINTLYKPRSFRAGNDLVELFARSEDAFFSNWNPVRITQVPELYSDGISGFFEWSGEYFNRAIPGELFLEPLFGSSPGFPVYLSVYMKREGRITYKKELQSILHSFFQLQNEFDDGGRVERIKKSISNMILDIDMVNESKELKDI